eukprot:GSMAST32.ASY1.ANO1.94.1 assembled CDS
MCDVVITKVTARDIRFHTSKGKHGSDAMSPDPEYSCVYVTLETNQPNLTGVSFSFSIGRGNEMMKLAVETLQHKVVGLKLSEITNADAEFGNPSKVDLCYGSQLKWCGPEKGPVHQGASAIINAMWDLWGKFENKPVWKLISDLEPEFLVGLLDFRYVLDMITPEEGIKIIANLRSNGHKERILDMMKNGFPAYTTATGWLGYTDDEVKQKVKNALEEGFRSFKMKVGVNIEDDCRRAEIMRTAIGHDCDLMMDANSVWEVQESIDNMRQLAKFNPYWIEEPLCTIQKIVRFHNSFQFKIYLNIHVATGEQMSNRVMHKQFLQYGAYKILQTDITRLGGINEYIVVSLMAAKMKVKICLHAGGVGLCNMAAHVCVFDHINLSGCYKGRMTEYIDHLQEHFVYDLVVRNGKYIAPTDAGLGLEMKEESLSMYEFPTGHYWSKVCPNHFYKSRDGIDMTPSSLYTKSK